MTNLFALKWKHFFHIQCNAGPILSHCIHTAHNSGNSYDVIIVGGGMVGGAMACALGKSNYFSEKKVLLLDASKKESTEMLENPGPYRARVCAISPGNARFLDSLGAWKSIPRVAPVQRMQVWDSCSDGLISFERNSMSDELCYIVENDMVVCSFNELLNTTLKDKVEVKNDCHVVACTNPRNYALENTKKNIPPVIIKLDDGSEISTKLLIAADGANSFLARSCGIKNVTYKYNQSAVVGNLVHDKCDNIVAWQRFLPTGPIALLPLNETTSSLVWSTTHAHAQKLVEMPEEEFLSEINNAFWQDHPQTESVKSISNWAENLLNLMLPDERAIIQYPPSVTNIVGGRFKFPLSCSHGTEYVKPRVAFVGDSIHRVHPLAGQGVNLGFRDVACLSKMLDEALYEGQDLGSIAYLLKFEAEQQQKNLPMVTAIHGLKHIFSTDFPPLVAVRSLGLKLCNANSAIKNTFIQEATQ